MTITTEDTKELFTGDGATVTWPFNFKITDASDLYVYTTSIEGVEFPLENWIATLNANQNTNPGGTITTEFPVADGIPGVIMRNMSFTRVNEFTDSIPPHVIEEELDRVTAYALQLRERLDRSVHVSAATQEFADVNLRNVPTRRGKLIGFDLTDRANVVLLELRDGMVVGPTGVTRVSRVEVSAPAVFRQDISGVWSHISCVVTFTWLANGVVELTRSITVDIDELNNRFATPTPVAGITVTQDAGKLLTKLYSEYEGVSDYIQLAAIRMADPVYTDDDFAPAWGSGEFTSPPVGDVHATNAAGVVTMSLAAALVAESGSTAMTWDAGSIPAGFRPTEDRTVQCKLRYNDTILTVGAVTIGADGSAVFARYNGQTGGFDAAGWQSGEDKGLPADWCVVYPL